MRESRIGIGMFVLAVIAGTTAVAIAQDNSTTKTTHKSTRALTGCLQRGDST